MHQSPNAERTPSAGMQILLDQGLRLNIDDDDDGPAPKPCGRAMLLAHSPDDLIQRLTRHCTVDGYTSWPALAVAFEAALREVHTEARAMLGRGAVL